jgi:hypothetical protein
MEHPLIGNISDLTLEELSSKVSELQKKLSIVQRSGNGHLANQIRMALESYYNVYQTRLQESYQKDQTGSVNFDNKINIQ